MRMFWIAAGFAAGYVMGTKAGHQRYEQMRQKASAALDHPVVSQVRDRVTDLAGRGLEKAAAKAGIAVEPVDVPGTNGPLVAGSAARAAARPSVPGAGPAI